MSTLHLNNVATAPNIREREMVLSESESEKMWLVKFEFRRGLWFVVPFFTLSSKVTTKKLTVALSERVSWHDQSGG